MKINQLFRTILDATLLRNSRGMLRILCEISGRFQGHSRLTGSGRTPAVKVSQDRDLGVVTLTGQVPSDDQKAQAESIARSFAAPQVVANQITVAPPGGESDAKKIDSDLDGGIEKDLDAALISTE